MNITDHWDVKNLTRQKLNAYKMMFDTGQIHNPRAKYVVKQQYVDITYETSLEKHELYNKFRQYCS